MSSKLTTTFVLLVFIIVMFLGFWLLTTYAAANPAGGLSQHESIVLSLIV